MAETKKTTAKKPAARPRTKSVKKPAPKLKLLMVGAECVPFAKTGGLADVMGTLPKDLIVLGIDCRVMIPFHSEAKKKYATQTEHLADFKMFLGWREVYVGVEKLELGGVTYYFIDNDYYFGGCPIYKGGYEEGEQYAYFTRAVLECLEKIDFMPDVMHVNDWHTAMIPMLIKTQYQNRPQGGIKTVFTIHNIMYQGQFDFGVVHDWLDVDPRYYTPDFIEMGGSANFMKGGLVFADKISTVSPSYVEELKTPYYAYGLHGVLASRADDFVGILNGIDTVEFDPENDAYAPYHFSAGDLAGKQLCKEALFEELGLTVPPTTPLMSMVTRLTHQKGLDLVMRVFHEIMEEDVAVVILGTGDAMYEDFFRQMEKQYPGRVCAYISYSNAVAHKLYAASDLFLMPSKFEPCGISQMIALRYGTLPIVRETGGLRDTVFPYDEQNGAGNGFSFTNFNAHDMLYVIRYALETISDPEKRSNLVKNAFACDNAFAVSAKKYYDMFTSIA